MADLQTASSAIKIHLVSPHDDDETAIARRARAASSASRSLTRLSACLFACVLFRVLFVQGHVLQQEGDQQGGVRVRAGGEVRGSEPHRKMEEGPRTHTHAHAHTTKTTGERREDGEEINKSALADVSRPSPLALPVRFADAVCVCAVALLLCSSLAMRSCAVCAAFSRRTPTTARRVCAACRRRIWRRER